MLRPGGLRKPTDEGYLAAVDTRDRIWSLLERSWEANVWRAGAYLFAREVDRYVPPLHSRVVGKRKARGTAPQPTVAVVPVAAPAMEALSSSTAPAVEPAVAPAAQVKASQAGA